MQALIKATPNSLNNCFPAVFKSNLPFAKPCTTMADDCIPTFPPVPPISGMKSAVAGFLASDAVYHRYGYQVVFFESHSYVIDRSIGLYRYRVFTHDVLYL